MEITEVLLAELKKAERLPYIPKQTIRLFNEFISSSDGRLLRANNIPHHACAFFLPVHTASQSIYLVHHIKAQDGIPPGGHIEPGETPTETVRREYKEELSWQLTGEPIKLTDLTIK